MRVHGGLYLRSRLRSRKVLGWRPDSIEDPPCTRAYVCLVHVKSDVVGPTSFCWCGAGSLARRVPVQVLSSSSDRGSKLRGPTQNSFLPLFVSKMLLNSNELRFVLISIQHTNYL
ncbi:hypothetical protein AVEN_234772-1 [Araneus ventricosus]|uniref:Uncharacterized protein n=1 Tax=Araneus ventricosus TaxID=182803 RepID=A0A4Y2LZ40_ARAVE|nr:hypothetical protein AVEN_234772-1 [Araneus ventricosus]